MNLLVFLTGVWESENLGEPMSSPLDTDNGLSHNKVSDFDLDSADIIFQMSGDSLKNWLTSSENNMGISNYPKLTRFVNWDEQGWISNLAADSEIEEPRLPWYGNVFGHRNLPEFQVKYDQMALRLIWHPTSSGESGDRTRRLGVRAFPLDRKGNRLRSQDPWIIPFLAHESDSFVSQTVWLPPADREVHALRLDLRLSDRFSWNLASIEVLAFPEDSSQNLIQEDTRRNCLNERRNRELFSYSQIFEPTENCIQFPASYADFSSETNQLGVMIWWKTKSVKDRQQMWWANNSVEVSWMDENRDEIDEPGLRIPIWGRHDATLQLSIFDGIIVPDGARKVTFSPNSKIFETVEIARFALLEFRDDPNQSKDPSFEFSSFSQRISGVSREIYSLESHNLEKLVDAHSEIESFSSCVSWDDSGYAILGEKNRSWFFEGLIGTNSLPWCKIDGPIIDIELHWKGIPRSGKNQFQQMLRFFWGDERGRVLHGVEPQAIPMQGDTSDLWKVDSFRGIPVHAKAKSVIIDICVPNQSRKGTILFRSLKISQPIVEEEIRILGGKEQVHISGDEINFRPELANDDRPLINSGLRLKISGFSRLSRWDNKFAIKQIPKNELFMAGKFENQIVRVLLSSGLTKEIRPSNCDLVSVDQDGIDAKIEWSIWNASERQLNCIIDIQEGQRESRNRALDLPPRDLEDMTLSIRETNSESPLVCSSFHPNGAESTIIFTEHADQQTVLTERLVMFGNTEGEFIEGQGWLGNGLPLTKTVFATGFRSGRDTSNKKRLTSLDHPEFYKLVSEYSKNWDDLVELGLHTFSSGPVSSDIGSSILEKYQNLGLKVWIDHGRQKNPTSLTRHGLEIKDKQYFIAPDLSESGIDILWSYRDFRNDGLNTISQGSPSNLIFSLPVFTGAENKIWKPTWFSTTRVNFNENTMSEQSLEKLCSENGVCLAHVYLSVNLHGHLVRGPEKELDIYDSWFEDGAPISLSPWFEEMLSRLSRWRNEGRIFLSNLGKWVRHVNNLHKVRIEQSEEKALIHNCSGETIPGFSLSICGNYSDLLIDDVKPMNSREGKNFDVIWWELSEGITKVSWSPNNNVN